MNTADSIQFRVLFVCLGNICRSPLAEGLFKKKVVDNGLESIVFVDSCGTSDYHIGETPDPRTLKNASSHGLVLNHLGRQLKSADFDYFDTMIMMDDSNISNAEKVKPEHFKSEIRKMGDFYLENPGADVPDPWFGGEAGFESVYAMLDKSTDELMNYVKSQLKI